MGLQSELAKFIESKEAIKTSIIAKDQSVQDTDAFNTYPEKIVAIPNKHITNLTLAKEIVEGTATIIVDNQTVSLRTHCLQNLKNLKEAMFSNLHTINPYAFQGCIRLFQLTLNCPWVVSLPSACAFRYTKLEHKVGNLYVPDDLLEDYMSHKVWKKFQYVLKPISMYDKKEKLVTVSVNGPEDITELEDVYFMSDEDV